jgi:hypothetical protein
MKEVLFFLTALLLITSCSDLTQTNNRVVVAKAGDKFLYRDELPDLAGNGMSREDSISIVRNYIDRWIKRELMMSRAEINLTEGYIAEIDQKLEETRENLMIYQYEQQMILQRMDTLVSQVQIENYYAETLQTFNLNNAIIKALFMKIPMEAPNIDRVRSWYRSDSQENLQNLESYCYQFADKFDDFGEQWINLNFLIREIPSEIEDQSRFLRNNEYFETSDSLYYYFVRIRDFRLRGSVAPVEFVFDDIKNIILNNRKIDFLQDLEDGIYNEALKENMFRIY